MVRVALKPMGERVHLESVPTIASARAWLDDNTPDLVIVALDLPDGKGTTFLPHDRDRDCFPVILLADRGHESEVVEAIKAGALDYLLKIPELLVNLPLVIERTLRQWGNIVRQRLTEDALRDSEERFRSMFVSAAAGMVVISPFNNILQVNRAFCEFTGYTEDELLSRNILDLTCPEDQTAIVALYNDLFARKLDSTDCERRYLRKDGSMVWGHVSVSCVSGADGEPAYCIALVQDITVRKALEEKLLLVNSELDAFVHTVSHDLRSPLTPIIGYLQFILEQHAGELSPAVGDMLREVLSQGMRMHAMLEDLLELATVGAVEPPEEPVSGDEIMQDVLLRYAADLDASGSWVTSTSLPSVMMPKTLYQQILDNLVGNAAQYAGCGCIEVSGERAGAMVRIAVRDHGPGVPQAEKKRIFDLFYRGSAGRAKTGTGIGLATVSRIARLHNGRAWVEDAPGGGSIFIVELLDGCRT
jgi:PAS domain S-box-containing protein